MYHFATIIFFRNENLENADFAKKSRFSPHNGQILTFDGKNALPIASSHRGHEPLLFPLALRRLVWKREKESPPPLFVPSMMAK